MLLTAAAISVGARELAARPEHRRALVGLERQRPSGASARQHSRPAVLQPAFFTNWRARFLTANAASDPRGLVRGIFLGERRAVTPEALALFHRAGLDHLLAADGFKCWLTAALFQLVFQLLLLATTPLLPSSALLRARLWGRAAALLAGAWTFWLWSEQSAAVTRAVILVSLKAALDLAGFAVSYSRLLLTLYLVSLATEPWLWHSPGFQLTYGCIFGILAVTRLAARFRPEAALRRLVFDHLCVNLGAIAGAIPTTLLVFEEVSLAGLHTHWFTVPPVAFALLPLAGAQMALLNPLLALDPAGPVIHALGALAAAVAELVYRALELWMAYMPELRIW